MIRRACICSASPAEWGADKLELGAFTLRHGAQHIASLGAPGQTVTVRGMNAAHFAASFDALATWNPLHKQAVRRIHDINPATRVGLGLAVESITAEPHGDPVLDALRNALLPLAYDPPVDYFAQSTIPWPRKPHCMAIDFEHRPDDVLRAVKGFLEAHVRPLELDFLFFDVLLAKRYWGQAGGIPPAHPGQTYSDVWAEIVSWSQAHVAPVWGHNSGVDVFAHPGVHRFRIEEHFYRLPRADRAIRSRAAAQANYVLVRSGEWRDIAPRLLEIRIELEHEALAGDAWVVAARSGSDFGIWS